MKGYVWYSSGSDVTGPALAMALGFSHGTKTPDFSKFDVVIGFGSKAGTKYNAETMKGLVEQRKLRLLNPVEAIEANRDKAGALTRLKAAGVSVAGHLVRAEKQTVLQFVSAISQAVHNGALALPIVGSARSQKGAPVFCHTMEEVRQALKGPRAEELQYFRSFCPGTEYRVHVLRDKPLFTQVKQPAKDPQAALTAELRASLQRRMQKEEKKFSLNETTLDWALKQLTPELLQGPGQMLRSLGRGWELAMAETTPAIANDVAVKALDALGLDMGAVSIEVDGTTARVTGITTAPNLDNMQMGLYVAQIKKFCSAKAETEKKIPDLVADDATPELMASLTRKLRGAKKEKLEAIAALLGD